MSTVPNRWNRAKKYVKKKTVQGIRSIFGYEQAGLDFQLRLLQSEIAANGRSLAEQIHLLQKEKELTEKLLLCGITKTDCCLQLGRCYLSCALQNYKETFTAFANLPTNLRLKIVNKCQAIPYVRLRRSCRSVNDLCENYPRSLGIYIYRRRPQLFLLTSLKETYPFNKQIKEDEEDIDGPYAVVEYGRLHGEANLKMALNRENLQKFQDSISGFNFPDVSILNYNDPTDDEANTVFAGAFDCFLEILADLHVGTLNIKGLTCGQYEQILSRTTVNFLSLQMDDRNEKLIEMELPKNIGCVYYPYSNPPNDQVLQELLKKESIRSIAWDSRDNNFNFDRLEDNLMDYKDRLDELYCLSFYLKEDPDFYELDLTSKEGRLFPAEAVHLGPLETNRLRPIGAESSDNLEKLHDYWFSKIDTTRWMIIVVERTFWTLLTSVRLGFDVEYGEAGVNSYFLSIFQDNLLLNNCPFDYSHFYEKLRATKTLDEKKHALEDYIEYTVSFYTNK